MPTIDERIVEIKALKTRYVDEIYGGVRTEQTLDKGYIDDTFDVGIKPPHRIFRSGIGRRMVDTPAERIITSNMQCFVEVLKGNEAAGERISAVINQQWIPIIRLQNPNPPKETVKNKLARGESFIKVVHNESWVTGKRRRVGLPVHFLILDPMVIYASPEEDENGIPRRVIVFYERQPEDVIVRYLNWAKLHQANYEGEINKNKKVQWLEYWDDDIRYFEADGESVLKGGIQPNLYKRVPFVRKYTGFGKRSPDGDLKHLIVSDIRFARDLIAEECNLRSDIASICHLFAHRPRTFEAPEGIDPIVVRTGLETILGFGAYDINVVPHGTMLMKDVDPSVPPEILQRHMEVMAEIAQRCPFILPSFPGVTSGRFQDIVATGAMRRYDTIIENTENEWATAFEMALKICDKIPTLKPDGLQKDDLKTTFKCTVKLKAPDPVEQDRLATLGSKLLTNSEIDPITNLVEFKGYTPEKAKKILMDMLKWRVLLGSPEIAELIGLRAAEKSGMLEDLEMIKARRQQLEQQGMVQELPPTGKQRVMGEVKTPAGEETAGRVVGARTPPRPYTRGA